MKSPVKNWMYDSSLEEHLLGVVLVQQYNLRKGLELFGDQAEEATKNELQKIHDFCTYIPMDARLLSREAKMKALSSPMFIAEKRDGRVKERKCAVGIRQRTFPGYVKLDWDLPMVTTDGVVITPTIKAHEGHDVAVADIPNEFINANNSKKTLMILKEKIA